MAKRFDRNSPLDRTPMLQHWAWNAEPVGAGLPAKAVVRSMEMRRMYWPLRGQARSHRVIGVA
ncbi:hypothetical protein F7R14_26575 [Pseudomonas lini]|uniref:Uncharacterized protein n=1 Tax=Pseudomonas lini TaxID=163011 RepID=A0A7V7NZY5_9PSED|nr:hypothetical protein F7R14_26575 [Pseudomonas lini]